MKKYSSRILAVDKGSFTPLIYTTFGGWGPQATAYHKRLASLISNKRNEEYHHVMNHIRTRIRFAVFECSGCDSGGAWKEEWTNTATISCLLQYDPGGNGLWMLLKLTGKWHWYETSADRRVENFLKLFLCFYQKNVFIKPFLSTFCILTFCILTFILPFFGCCGWTETLLFCGRG